MVVADYSRHGDLVVDPCCGAGTTLVAARMLGRSAIGIDTCREHLEIAARRLAKVREQVTLGAEFTDMTQEGLPL
jgi:DNA modification methylase